MWSLQDYCSFSLGKGWCPLSGAVTISPRVPLPQHWPPPFWALECCQIGLLRRIALVGYDSGLEVAIQAWLASCPQPLLTDTHEDVNQSTRGKLWVLRLGSLISFMLSIYAPPSFITVPFGLRSCFNICTNLRKKALCYTYLGRRMNKTLRVWWEVSFFFFFSHSTWDSRALASPILNRLGSSRQDFFSRGRT